MDKYKKIGLYVMCVLCGIYTADMIYRFVRYISSAADGDAFQKTMMLMGTVFLDGGSFMIISAVCAFLIVAATLWLKVLRVRTVVAYAVNLISCLVFVVLTSDGDASVATVLTVAVTVVPVYLLTGLWCIYFSIRDLCNYFLKLEEKN